jgi:hypothetical protein
LKKKSKNQGYLIEKHNFVTCLLIRKKKKKKKNHLFRSYHYLDYTALTYSLLISNSLLIPMFTPRKHTYSRGHGRNLDQVPTSSFDKSRLRSNAHHLVVTVPLLADNNNRLEREPLSRICPLTKLKQLNQERSRIQPR